jgi:hypothetical protein
MVELAGFIGALVAAMLDPIIAAIGIGAFYAGRSRHSWMLAAMIVFWGAVLVTMMVLWMNAGFLRIQPGAYFARELMAAAAWFGLTVLVVRSTNGQGITKA